MWKKREERILRRRGGRDKMRIAVCDDERDVREILAEKVKSFCPEAEVFLYASGQELLASKNEADILFLDIQMPGLDGMETAGKLRERNKGLIIIFVTALEEYVFRAFDVGAFHYLVKPFSEEKFGEVLQSAATQYAAYRKAAYLWNSAGAAEIKGGEAPAGGWSMAEMGRFCGMPEAEAGQFYGMPGPETGRFCGMPEAEAGRFYGMPGPEQEARCIMIQSGGSHIKIRLRDIIYAEVFNRKVVIHKAAEDLEYYGKLSDLEKLAGEDFFRPHRAFLVNFRYIVKYNAAEITLEKGMVPISKKNYPVFVKSYLKYNQRTGGGRRV